MAVSFWKKFIDKLPQWVGSWWSLIIHTIWFVGWIFTGLNIETLIMIVSLEAIYLCILLLMASNEAEKRREAKAQLDHETVKQKTEEDIELDREARDDLKYIQSKLEKIEQELSIS